MIVEILRRSEEKIPATSTFTNDRMAGKIKNVFSRRELMAEPRAYAVAPNRTETSFETPGSCIVTPYSTGAMLIVFLL